MYYIYDTYIVNIGELFFLGDTFGFLEGVDEALPQADGAEGILRIDSIWMQVFSLLQFVDRPLDRQPDEFGHISQPEAGVRWQIAALDHLGDDVEAEGVEGMHSVRCHD